jgi:hypothetical protein
METFFFIPEENLDLLDGRIFAKDERAHLVSMEDPGATKGAARLFQERNRLPRIPKVPWRYEASRCRGYFVLEHMLRRGVRYDWLTQTVSAAFGPIGIYAVLGGFEAELGKVPRFLGIQQAANCPMARAWRSGRHLTGAAALAACRAGASALDVTVNGLGDRAGNAPLEQVALALHVKGYETGIRLEELRALSEVVARESGVPVSKLAPAVGDYVFVHKSPAHGEAPELFEAYPPGLVGAERSLEETLNRPKSRVPTRGTPT